MDSKKSFVLYIDYRQHISLLSDEERGQLLLALFDYAEKKIVSNLNGAAMMAFSFIKSQMDRDAEKYAAVCEKNQKNGAKGGRPPKDVSDMSIEKPKTTERFLEKPKKPDTDTDTDTGNDIDTDREIPPLIPPLGGDENNGESLLVEMATGESEQDSPSRTRNSRKIKAELSQDQRISFDRFWAIWPNKVSKGQAETTWKKINPNDTVTIDILRGVELAKKHDRRFLPGGYTPHPSTWLNAKGWMDEFNQGGGVNAQGNGGFIPSSGFKGFAKQGNNG